MKCAITLFVFLAMAILSPAYSADTNAVVVLPLYDAVS
jgi:hypothetical protein